MDAVPTRHIVRAVALILLTGAAVGLAAAQCGGEPSPGPRANASGSHLPATPVTAVQAPGGGGLQVVESGVSMVSDALGDTMATYGILVENTSRTQVALDAQVVITLLDTAGRPVTDRLAESTRVTETLEVVLPGQRVGMGRYTYVPRDRTVASVRVEFGVARWRPPPTDYPVASLTASGVTTSITRFRLLTRDRVSREVRIDFTVENGYPVQVRSTIMALLRDTAGAIVGGTAPKDLRTSNHLAPGRSRGEIRSVGTPPPGLDLTRTGVYVHQPPQVFPIR